MVEFTTKNSMHASTQNTPFVVNGLRHPRLPTTSIKSTSKIISTIAMTLLFNQMMMTMLVFSASPTDFPVRMMTPALMNRKRRGPFLQFAQGELNKKGPISRRIFAGSRRSGSYLQVSFANAADRQKRNADKNERAKVLLFTGGDLVLLATVNLPRNAVNKVGSSILLPNSMLPFRVLR